VAPVVNPKSLQTETAGVAANRCAALDHRNAEFLALGKAIGCPKTGRSGAKHCDLSARLSHQVTVRVQEEVG
jgi:hypothetical protein